MSLDALPQLFKPLLLLQLHAAFSVLFLLLFFCAFASSSLLEGRAFLRLSLRVFLLHSGRSLIHLSFYPTLMRTPSCVLCVSVEWQYFLLKKKGRLESGKGICDVDGIDPR